nr:uncharacterized protein LOC125422702 [Ziziphus jujuba var. spinosa]
MLFYLTTLNLARFLSKDAPLGDEESDEQTLMVVDVLKHSDYFYQNYVLNGLSDASYEVYCGTKIAKELYGAFVSKLRIKDDNRRSDKRSLKVVVKANTMEHGQSSKNKKKTRRDSKLEPKGRISKKAKFQNKCFKCDKMGHRAAEYRLPKRKKNKEAQMMEQITSEVDKNDLSFVVFEVKLVGSNPREWWIDTCVTHHVCSDKNLFTSFEPTKNGKNLFMGNSATSKI